MRRLRLPLRANRPRSHSGHRYAHVCLAGSHGQCDLLPPPDSTTHEHTPQCICDAGYHCLDDDCTAANACVPDVPPTPTPPPPPPPPCEACPDHMHRDPLAPADDHCRCACDDGYCGPQCQVHDPVCCDVSCTEHGRCVEGDDGHGVCRCEFADKTVDPLTHHPAWYGDQCQYLDQCREKNCGSHGQCVDSRPDCEECMSAECQCNQCYSGDSCETAPPACTDLDTCEPMSCGEHGEVVEVDGHCTCQCSDCYTGSTCEIAPDPCTDLATCMVKECPTCDTLNTDTCECEAPIDACLQYNCGSHGHCESTRADECHPFANPTCVCDPGFSGEACEIDACVVNDVYCGSNGRCVHTEENPGTCACLNGWTGEHCEIPPPPVDPCIAERRSCGDHGQCGANDSGGDDADQSKCFCDPGWCGLNCEMQEWSLGAIFSLPPSTSMPGGQNVVAGAGAVGFAAVAAVALKRRMGAGAASDDGIYSTLGQPVV